MVKPPHRTHSKTCISLSALFPYPILLDPGDSVNFLCVFGIFLKVLFFSLFISK